MASSFRTSSLEGMPPLERIINYESAPLPPINFGPPPFPSSVSALTPILLSILANPTKEFPVGIVIDPLITEYREIGKKSPWVKSVSQYFNNGLKFLGRMPGFTGLAKDLYVRHLYSILNFSGRADMIDAISRCGKSKLSSSSECKNRLFDELNQFEIRAINFLLSLILYSFAKCIRDERMMEFISRVEKKEDREQMLKELTMSSSMCNSLREYRDEVLNELKYPYTVPYIPEFKYIPDRKSSAAPDTESKHEIDPETYRVLRSEVGIPSAFATRSISVPTTASIPTPTYTAPLRSISRSITTPETYSTLRSEVGIPASFTTSVPTVPSFNLFSSYDDDF